MPTRSQIIAADVAALLRARNCLLWIVTREEARAEAHLFEAAASARYIARTWDVATGFADISGKPFASLDERDPGAALTFIAGRAQENQRPERGLWLMRDLPVWLAGITGATPCRQLRNLARSLPTAPSDSSQAIVILSPSKDIPPELANHATVIEWTLPDREEIAEILDAAIAGLPEGLQTAAAPNGTRAAAIDAAIGLTGEEAASCYARSLVQTRTIDPLAVAKEKKRVVSREGLLEWFDPLPGGLDAVGGLDTLKAWLLSRKSAYSPAARAYGLPAPRGCFLAGISGCGKSLTAKAAATAFGVPLLKLDLGGLKSKFVGESEGNLRKAFATIEAVGNCVVWLDEVEKSLAGATQGAADGGVSADAMGAILTWMQERKSEAFVIATANQIDGLPPEFLRKGRWDELFFVDLPNHAERMEIIAAALRANNRGDLDTIDFPQIAEATDTFTGSEIAALVPDALFMGFEDGARPITTDDIVKAAANVTPLAKTAQEKIKTMREWADGRARRATSVAQAKPTTRARRALDL